MRVALAARSVSALPASAFFRIQVDGHLQAEISFKLASEAGLDAPAHDELAVLLRLYPLVKDTHIRRAHHDHVAIGHAVRCGAAVVFGHNHARGGDGLFIVELIGRLEQIAFPQRHRVVVLHLRLPSAAGTARARIRDRARAADHVLMTFLSADEPPASVWHDDRRDDVGAGRGAAGSRRWRGGRCAAALVQVTAPRRARPRRCGRRTSAFVERARSALCPVTAPPMWLSPVSSRWPAAARRLAPVQWRLPDPVSSSVPDALAPGDGAAGRCAAALIETSRSRSHLAPVLRRFLHLFRRGDRMRSPPVPARMPTPRRFRRALRELSRRAMAPTRCRRRRN